MQRHFQKHEILLIEPDINYIKDVQQHEQKLINLYALKMRMFLVSWQDYKSFIKPKKQYI